MAGDSPKATELKERKKTAESKPAAPQKVQATPTASPSGSLMPFYLVLLAIVAVGYNFVEGRVYEMQREEARNWNPAPQNMAKNEVTILYCSSWAFEGTFRQVFQLINQRADKDLDVAGGHYPVPPSKLFYAQIFQYIQFFFFAMLFGSEAVFENLGLPCPQPFKALAQNKMASFMLIWMAGNVAQSAFTNTQAFEIYYANDLVWSSLKMGRLPNYPELVEAFRVKGVNFK